MSREHNALMLGAALHHAINGWGVFPLRGKFPAISKDIGGRGLYDATTDLDTITAWWTGEYSGCNIGIRPPAGIFVLDTDPKTAGHWEAYRRLLDLFGPLPTTLTNISGRLDGGCHRFYRRPPGKLITKHLGPGFDIKDSGGYVVAPPSIHPATGWRYRVGNVAPIAEPGWLAPMIIDRPKPKPAPRPANASVRFLSGLARRSHGLQSPAEAFEDSARWLDILGPHGWDCLDGDGEGDGDRWRHPSATSPYSATVKHGCLFVYSPNTPFTPTNAGDANGYTKFRAHAVLNHNGDLSAAARRIRQGA